jgi:hypothetical protein
MGRNKLAQLQTHCGELGDAIRADAVDADVLEGFPFVRIVGGPGDDSRVDGMGARHQFFIDERHLLPEILCPGSDERCYRIYMTRYLENASSNGGENPLYGFDNAMIESVHSAPRAGFANASHYQWLDVSRLDFDINHRPITNSIENLFERGNFNAVRQWEAANLRCGEIDYSSSRRSRRVHDRIVVHNDDAVAGGMHIELDRVGSELDRPEKSWYGILRQRLVRTSVGDLFGLGARP